MSLPVRRVAAPVVLVVLLLAASVGNVAALSGMYPHQGPGNRGVNVKALQHLLRHHDAAVRVDGVFGATTTEATRAFQVARALPATGEADARTWASLIVPLDRGSSGEAVLALKRLLIEKRAEDLSLTPTYDAATRAAVVRFQQHVRRTADGVARSEVWRLLLAHLELPVWAASLCDYSVGNGRANWGTAAAIGQLQAAAIIARDGGHGRVAVGDIGFEHGGDLPGHETHEQGLDVDVRPMRKAKDQCLRGVSYRSSGYDRAATRALIRAVRATAPGHVKVIYFNDPVLIGEGLVRRYEGHDDHLHIRYCEKVHLIAAYTC